MTDSQWMGAAMVLGVVVWLFYLMGKDVGFAATLKLFVFAVALLGLALASGVLKL